LPKKYRARFRAQITFRGESQLVIYMNAYSGCISKLFLYQGGRPWSQLIVIGANGFSSAGTGLMAAAMLGDVDDVDESETGLRREGLYGSALAEASSHD
jgi:Na+/melibiose symporter-like transporter